MKRRDFPLVSISVALLLAACGESGDQAAAATVATSAPALMADAIYTNARVYTVDASNSWAEAVAVRASAPSRARPPRKFTVSEGELAAHAAFMKGVTDPLWAAEPSA